MGQKANPIGVRVTVNKDWRSRWFADKKSYGRFAVEDDRIRRWVKERLYDAAIAMTVIERHADMVRLTIHAARPGLIFGRRGEDRKGQLEQDLRKMTGREVFIDVVEVRDPDRNAQLVAEGIATQLERRVSFRRAMRRAAELAMERGVEGIRIRVSGRLGGAELARSESLHMGKVPLQTFRELVDYGFAEARTPAGQIGVKVWICHKPDEKAGPTWVRKERSHAANA